MIRAPISRQQGAVLVELSVILPLLLLLSFATLEFARAITAYKTLVNQVRIAARHLANLTPGAGHIAADCIVRYGVVSDTAPCGGTLLLPGLAGAVVTVSDAANAPSTQRAQATTSDTGAVTVNLVTVKVSSYVHPLASAGFLTGIFRGQTSITFGTISATMRQVL
jgi:Flp pilus assembly protein TadG